MLLSDSKNLYKFSYFSLKTDTLNFGADKVQITATDFTILLYPLLQQP